MMRVVYVGQLWDGGTCIERAKVLRIHGWQVAEFDITPYLKLGSRVVRSLQHRFVDGPDVRRFNRDLLDYVRMQPRPDIVWIDKGRWVFAETLARIKEMTNALLVHYTPDPAFSVHTSRHFMRGLAWYDICITTKRYEMDSYLKAGAANVIFTLQGIDDRFERCGECAEFDHPNRKGVVFVGHREPHYENTLANLASPQLGLSIWGPGWEHLISKRTSVAKSVKGGAVWREQYVQTLAGGQIGIGLLSKLYPDQFTTRSFEIPGAGAMLLAERTTEHIELFKEGVEAEFFSSVDELIDKARFYLGNPVARLAIARRGRVRAMAEYKWSNVLIHALQSIEALR